MEEVFLKALHAEPNHEVTWQALADWLEQNGQGQRAEVVRCQLRPLHLAPLLVNSIGMRFALIPPGVFLMGSPDDEEGRSGDEGPQHEVKISLPCYMGVFPVTQAQWHAVMGDNPSYFSASGGGKDRVRGMSTDDFPVEQVNWGDASEFLEKLAALKNEREEGWEYRLPTEAEWEYACRAGTTTTFHYGKALCSTQANFNGNYPYGGAAKGPYLERTSKVGSYKPNRFGLHDMHGNVFEWCADWYDQLTVGKGRWPFLRVLRGGCWGNGGSYGRSATRHTSEPGTRSYEIGFRVALALSREIALSETKCSQCGAPVNSVTREGLQSPGAEPWLLFCDQCKAPVEPDV